MLYQALAPKQECIDKIVNVVKLLLITTTTVSSVLTFVYIQKLATGLENAGLGEVKEIFEQLRECVLESHICEMKI